MQPLAVEIKNIYFLGIGGIGMSALARYFKAKGYAVAGYDRTPSSLTERMKSAEGIGVNYTDDAESVPAAFRDKGTTLVIYTPAVPPDNCQMEYFRRQGFVLYKRAEVLGMISCRKKAICVAGTHGKTTISTMTAFLLKYSSVGCNAFLGGISMNFGTNLLLDPDSPYVVIEADEFDRSFLHLYPEIAIISAMDADHLDIYGDEASLVEAFEAFAGQVRPEGRLFIKEGLEITSRRVDGCYGVDVEADHRATGLHVVNGRYVFDYHSPEVDIPGLVMGIPGRVNVENAVAAITLALAAGVTSREIQEALPEFRGVVRRFNIHVETPRCMYIDDYAHHPREIEATLTSVREMWPGEKITVVFQPHLYTRTRDFYGEFAQSLSLADEVILLDIYPARELPIPGITSETIRERLTVPGKIVARGDLMNEIKKDFNGGIIITMGAGDIDRLIPSMKEILSGRKC